MRRVRGAGVRASGPDPRRIGPDAERYRRGV